MRTYSTRFSKGTPLKRFGKGPSFQIPPPANSDTVDQDFLSFDRAGATVQVLNAGQNPDQYVVCTGVFWYVLTRQYTTSTSTSRVSVCTSTYDVLVRVSTR